MAQKYKDRKVRYEFFTYQGQIGTLVTQINLKIENPASIRFTCLGAPFTLAVINNIYYLGPIIEFVNGTAQAPYELILENNGGEIDVTTYSLKLTPGAAVQVTCKYYVND